jgi:hypothetical protein
MRVNDIKIYLNQKTFLTNFADLEVIIGLMN